MSTSALALRLCLRLLVRPRPFPMEIGFQPRVLGREHGVHGSCGDHFVVGQDRDPVADGVQAVEVVSYHENSQAQSALQRGD
jgi:hypothetical protein